MTISHSLSLSDHAGEKQTEHKHAHAVGVNYVNGGGFSAVLGVNCVVFLMGSLIHPVVRIHW